MADIQRGRKFARSNDAFLAETAVYAAIRAFFMRRYN